MAAIEPGVGISWLFHVTIDAVDIGVWTECSGLSAKYEVEEYREGGENMFTHKLVGALKYDNVKLKRPLDHQSGAVARWFAQAPSMTTGATASIKALDRNLKQITAWELADVYPVSWTGPTFNATGNNLATEELELIHHGFI